MLITAAMTDSTVWPATGAPVRPTPFLTSSIGAATTSAGVAIIKYKLASGATTTYNITVNAIPMIPSIAYAVGAINPQKGASGAGSFCNNKTFGVVGVPSGGVWQSSNTSMLTIDCSNIVNTVGIGGVSLTYTYTSPFGCSNSRTISGTVVGCAARGVNNGQLTIDNLQFTMYPNPAHSFISLNVNTLIGAGTIVVTDLYGKQVKSQTLSMGSNTIDISTLSKGMYFISTITNEGKTTKKLVVE